MIWSGAMMLDHLGEEEAGAAVVGAIADLLKSDGPKTRDLGGNASTEDVGKAIADAL
jgi:tartrate dehydrogenase/decarboxylase/D-malate dehydrogenase